MLAALTLTAQLVAHRGDWQPRSADFYTWALELSAYAAVSSGIAYAATRSAGRAVLRVLTESPSGR